MDISIHNALEEYRKCHPRRSSGGINALSGFSYQLRVYIAELTLALSKSCDQKVESTSARAFLEAFSDIATVDDSNITLIQVKRTLTTSTLTHSASEIRAIFDFFREYNPCLLSKLRFKVIARKTSSIKNWKEIIDTELGEGFSNKYMEETGTDSDPIWDVVVNSYQHITNPYEFIRYALDRSLNISNNPGSSALIRDDICEYFLKLRKENYFQGQFLTKDDFREQSIGSKIEVGKSATIDRVRHCQYMSRGERVQKIRDKLASFSADLSFRSSTVGVFWLSGKSGVGKSVLLLQVLQNLVYEGARVLWLRGSTQELERVIKELIRYPGLPCPDFIAIDDLYDRDARVRLDLVGLSELIDRSLLPDFPIIITCGPSEFCDSFEEDTCYQGFTVCREIVKPIDRTESTKFLSWYRERTGINVKTGDAFEQCQNYDGGLFISLAIEFGHGDLRQFAKRFADRAELSGLRAALALPLALNRLYLKSPIGWIEESEREKLETLNSDGDFNVLEPGSPGESIRIAHPHIGDALYLACRTPSNKLSYTNDLVFSFRRSIEEKRIGLASQMLKMFSLSLKDSQRERLSIVDNNLLAKKCAEIWRNERDSISDSNDLLRISAGWACWIDERKIITEVLGEDLIDRFIFDLSRTTKYWAMCFDWLSLSHENSNEILDKFSAFLCNESLYCCSGWPYVWQKTFKGYSDFPPEILKETGFRWLQKNMESKSWTYIWRMLFGVYQKDSRRSDEKNIVNLGLKWLAVYRSNNGWSYVWQDLAEYFEKTNSSSIYHKDLLSDGLRWIEEYDYSQGWSYVLRDALIKYSSHIDKSKICGLAENCLVWLKNNNENKDWPFVWESLVAFYENSPKERNIHVLILLGSIWQKENIGCSSPWVYLTQKLMEITSKWGDKDTCRQIFKFALSWLIVNHDSPHWPYLYQVSLENHKNANEPLYVDRCVEQGVVWLNSHCDTLEWPETWTLTIEYSLFLSRVGVREQLLQLGIDWVCAYDSHKNWSYAWQKLVKYKSDLLVAPYVERLITISLSWLSGKGESVEWAHVWQLLYELSLSNDSSSTKELASLGCEWVKEHQEDAEWPYIYEFLLQEEGLSSAPIDLVSIGLTWLNGKLDHSQWSHVWRSVLGKLRLTAVSENNQIMFDLGCSWLESRDDLSDWPFVWQCLIKDFSNIDSDEEMHVLLKQGIKWLNNREHRNEWSYILKALLKNISYISQERDRSDVVSIAIDWAQIKQLDTNWREITLMLISTKPNYGIVKELSESLESQITESPNSRDWHKLDFLFRKIDQDFHEHDIAVHKMIASYKARRESPVWVEAVLAKRDSLSLFGRILNRRGDVVFVQLELGLIARMFDQNHNRSLHKNSKHKFIIREIAKDKDKVVVVLESEFRLSANKLAPGNVCKGVVTGHATYGMFVKIYDTVGLLHKSKCKNFDTFKHQYPHGSGVTVKILDIVKGKLVLGEVPE